MVWVETIVIVSYYNITLYKYIFSIHGPLAIMVWRRPELRTFIPVVISMLYLICSIYMSESGQQPAGDLIPDVN